MSSSKGIFDAPEKQARCGPRSPAPRVQKRSKTFDLGADVTMESAADDAVAAAHAEEYFDLGARRRVRRRGGRRSRSRKRNEEREGPLERTKAAQVRLIEGWEKRVHEGFG